MTLQDGWLLAEQFTSAEEETRRVLQGVGLVDMSWLAKFDVKSGAHNFALPRSVTIKRVRLARGHWLVLCPPSDVSSVTEQLVEPRQTNACYHVTDVTSVYAVLCLAGPRSPEVLSRLTSLNSSDPAFPNDACAQTSLAHVHAIVIRSDLARAPAYLVVTGREYAEYVWDSILHSAKGFGIVPFGLAGLRLLGR